jgi:hypothetical protein
MPLAKTFFSSRFGVVADRFGVSWMVYVAPWGPAPSGSKVRARLTGGVDTPSCRR